MTYLGALVLQLNDSELCLITGKVLVGNRVKLQRWSDGSVRTAKEEHVVHIPVPDAVERLRTLLVSETHPPAYENLDGKLDLVAAAYAYTSAFSGVMPTDKLSRGIRTIDGLNNTDSSATHSTTIAPFKEDFVREAIIVEVLLSNLTVNASGKIAIWGTKVDMIRLIQVYCCTAGVRFPTKSLVLRRFDGIISFFTHKLAEPDLAFVLNNLYPLRELRVDIQEMEP
ncbi:hypothetical protein FQ192_22030 [Pseudomonas sp. ANT_J12]|uniref:hypothetical protein n=1 Tax=Pseudomonas sp. ANT_J12 TaxID=2597351 RepID=UPI0011F0FEEC|nr:hypothetical protein [Pseudomonas sp. ANT_J12]KAA0987314.1 hypothetical protein FQ192_22030 [Pseudomonas sp. ANT_J12]